MSDYKELDDYIAQLCADGLTYNAVFVPQSASRNSDEESLSLNWRISLKNKEGKRLDTDYMQGIGHVPKIQEARASDGGPWTHIMRHRLEKYAAEIGRYWLTHYKEKRLPVPALRDVLYSLVLDEDVLNSAGFEEWVSSYGYDTDSRKAERIYEDCKRTAYDLQRVLGAAAVARLAELFQGY